MFTRRVFAAGAVSLLTAGPGLSATARPPAFRWPRGRGAAVSLTYDDGLNSQLEAALPDLQAAGFKATFFLTQENMNARLRDWQALFRQGHEVGNHSMTHPCELDHCTSRVFRQREIAPMEAYLDANFSPRRVRTYAYPCGLTGLGEGAELQKAARYRQALRGQVVAARPGAGAVNDPRRAAHDPLNLHGYEPTWDVDDPQRAVDHLRQAQAIGGWAIWVFHDVVDARVEEGQTSRASHQAILKFLAEEPVWVAPMGEVFRYVARSSRV